MPPAPFSSSLDSLSLSDSSSSSYSLSSSSSSSSDSSLSSEFLATGFFYGTFFSSTFFAAALASSWAFWAAFTAFLSSSLQTGFSLNLAIYCSRVLPAGPFVERYFFIFCLSLFIWTLLVLLRFNFLSFTCYWVSVIAFSILTNSLNRLSGNTPSFPFV